MKIKRMPGHTFDVPNRGTTGSCGYDLQSRIELTLYPGEHKLIPTGWAIRLPIRMAGMILPRSGLAKNYGVTVLNAPGLVDEDYRGEIHVLLINHGDIAHNIRIGDKIAQIVIMPIYMPTWVEVNDLGETNRGDCGFGSTGR